MAERLDKLRFHGELVGGVLQLPSAPLMRAMLRKYDDCRVTLNVERVRSTRSARQNAYYWGVVLAVIADATGHTQEELHEAFKSMFLRKQIIRVGPREIVAPGSTTRLTVGEFAEYLMRVTAEAAQIGIEVPPPTERLPELTWRNDG